MDTTAPLIDDRFVFIEVAVFYNTITILYKDIEVQEGKHGKPFFGVYIYMYYSTKDGYYIYILIYIIYFHSIKGRVLVRIFSVSMDSISTATSFAQVQFEFRVVK
jgi:hypothetical protein